MSDALGRRPPGRRPSSALRLLAGVFSLLLLAGCRVDTAVDVEATTGGGGHVRVTVTLDEDAAAQVPDLAEQLRADDAVAAGWRLEGPSPARGGGVTLRATRRFDSPAGAARALEELSGTGGPLRSLRLTRERTFWETTTVLAGSVDLTPGLDVLGDDELNKLLGGPSLGMDIAALEREVGRPLAEVLTFEMGARLPGDVASNAPRTEGGAVFWPVPLGQAVPVTATSKAWNVANIALGGVSLVSALSLLAVLVRRSRAVSWG